MLKLEHYKEDSGLYTALLSSIYFHTICGYGADGDTSPYGLQEIKRDITRLRVTSIFWGLSYRARFEAYKSNHDFDNDILCTLQALREKHERSKLPYCKLVNMWRLKSAASIKDNWYFSKDKNVFEGYDEIFEPDTSMDYDEDVLKLGVAIALGKEADKSLVNPLTGKQYDILEYKDSVKIGFSFRRVDRSKYYVPPLDQSTGKPYEMDKRKDSEEPLTLMSEEKHEIIFKKPRPPEAKREP